MFTPRNDCRATVSEAAYKELEEVLQSVSEDSVLLQIVRWTNGHVNSWKKLQTENIFFSLTESVLH